jgi:uncharacterized membrane protein
MRRPIVAKLAPLAIALFGYAAFLVGMAVTYARLPERMASHFDASGAANDWMTATPTSGSWSASSPSSR